MWRMAVVKCSTPGRLVAAPLWTAAVCLIVAGLSGCPVVGERNFLQDLGILEAESGGIALVVCGESEGLKLAEINIEPGGRSLTIENNEAEQALHEVLLTSQQPGYSVTGSLLEPDDDSLTVEHAEGMSGLGTMTIHDFDLTAVRKGYVLGSGGEVVPYDQWRTANDDCWNN